MAYEYQTEAGTLSLLRIGQRWAIAFNGRQRCQWLSPDTAARAASRHKTGLTSWDHAQVTVSDDVMRWRPLGESL